MKPEGGDVGHRRRRGQALVEFALVAPMFFLLMVGLIEFGRAVYYVQVLNGAAREGARYAIVHGSESLCPSGPMPGAVTNACDPTGSNVVAAVKQYAFGIVDNGSLTIMRCWNTQAAPSATCANGGGDYGPGNNQRNSPVYVEVSFNYSSLLAPFVPLPPFTLSGESTLVVNH